jgi:hypothetical protein
MLLIVDVICSSAVLGATTDPIAEEIASAHSRLATASADPGSSCWYDRPVASRGIAERGHSDANPIGRLEGK